MSLLSQLTGQDYDGIDVTIAAAGSLSTAADIGAGVVVGLVVPTITSASLSFQTSVDGATFVEVFNSDGTTATSVGASTGNRFVAAPAAIQNVAYLKVRSGTSGAAVAQAGGATITLLVQRIAASA